MIADLEEGIANLQKLRSSLISRFDCKLPLAPEPRPNIIQFPSSPKLM
jgi:hypothetical protein